LFQMVGGPQLTAPLIGQPVLPVVPTTPEPFRGSCAVIIDANTGTLISVRG